jgi:hypothetical protein
MSSRRRAIYAAFFGTGLAACAPAAPSVNTGPANSAGAAGSVAVREHLSGRYIALIGPKAQHDPPYLDTPETNFFCLRSFIDRQTGETADQLYVVASYDSKRDWDAAHDGSGQGLKFIPISRYKIVCQEEDNCSYAEEFAAAIPESDLRQNPKGLSVTFTDRAGDAQTINISAEQIAAQLTALAEHQKPGRDAGVAPGSPHQP